MKIFKAILIFLITLVLIQWKAMAMPGNDSSNSLHIYFGFNSSQVREKGAETIAKFLKNSLAQDKHYTICISGYCDAAGSLEYNDALSLKRVNAVKMLLLQNGIDSSSVIKETGYGKRRPCNANRTSAERRENRRVDILIETDNKPYVSKADMKKFLGRRKVGNHIVLKDLDFVGGMHRLLPAFLPELDTLVQVLQNDTALAIRIVGHVCCTADGLDGLDFETNTPDLSVNRAKAVYDYLLKNKIDKKRLSYTGVGGSFKLVFPELTAEDQTLNRRVEVVIVKD